MRLGALGQDAAFPPCPLWLIENYGFEIRILSRREVQTRTRLGKVLQARGMALVESRYRPVPLAPGTTMAEGKPVLHGTGPSAQDVVQARHPRIRSAAQNRLGRQEHWLHRRALVHLRASARRHHPAENVGKRVGLEDCFRD